MAVEVASAYVSLVPSAKGFGAKAERAIATELAGVGDRQGAAFSKGFADRAAQGFEKFGKKASVFVTAPIVAGFAFATKAASDLSESVNKTDVVFGKSAKAVHEFAAHLGEGSRHLEAQRGGGRRHVREPLRGHEDRRAAGGGNVDQDRPAGR